MSRRPIAAAALLLAATPPAIPLAARAQPAGGVVVTRPWARATPPGAKTGAAYMTLTSRTADKLVAVTTPAAGMAQLHEMSMQGDVMRMRALQGGLDLPAGKPVTLAPGGDHVMLMDMTAPLVRGQTLHLRLTFAHAPPVDVDAPIGSIGATTPPP